MPGMSLLFPFKITGKEFPCRSPHARKRYSHCQWQLRSICTLVEQDGHHNVEIAWFAGIRPYFVFYASVNERLTVALEKFIWHAICSSSVLVPWYQQRCYAHWCS